MEQLSPLFPAALVVAAILSVKWLTDLLLSAWPGAPSWAKRLIAYVVALALCASSGTDIVDRGSPLGLALSALALAALAGEVAHPALEWVRSQYHPAPAPEATAQ